MVDDPQSTIDDNPNPLQSDPPAEEYTPAWTFSSFDGDDEGSSEFLIPTNTVNVAPEIQSESDTLIKADRLKPLEPASSKLPAQEVADISLKVEVEERPEMTEKPRRIELTSNATKPYKYAENPVVIEFENVTKSFQGQMVLRDLSFQIRQGETVCLIGESGCGKTVNLKLMIGLMKPDKGKVSFKGNDLAKMTEKQLTATRIKFGFLFQMAALFDSMSIYDNVAFGLREHRLMPESQMPEYIRERLAEVGLPAGVELKKPAELSGGQRKRVGLARALALKPEVMLYDEPTTGLDPIMTDIINELIIQTQDHGAKSGIIVTHEMRTVVKCADRVIMLYPITRLGPRESQILYNGPPDAMEDHSDARVRQFVRGEAGERIREMNVARMADEIDTGVAPMDPDDIVSARPPKY